MVSDSAFIFHIYTCHRIEFNINAVNIKPVPFTNTITTFLPKFQGGGGGGNPRMATMYIILETDYPCDCF